MKTCKGCKYLDTSRVIFWRGMFNNFYVCRKQELEQKAANIRDNKKGVIFAPSYLDVDGMQHGLTSCADELSENIKKYLNEFNFEG